jgi:hypothetical protein
MALDGKTGRIEIALLRDGYRTHGLRPGGEVTWCDHDKTEIVLHRSYQRMRFGGGEVYLTVGARSEVTCGLCMEQMDAVGEEEWT